jgi:hypothetical protein
MNADSFSDASLGFIAFMSSRWGLLAATAFCLLLLAPSFWRPPSVNRDALLLVANTVFASIYFEVRGFFRKDPFHGSALSWWLLITRSMFYVPQAWILLFLSIYYVLAIRDPKYDSRSVAGFSALSLVLGFVWTDNVNYELSVPRVQSGIIVIRPGL